jgi:transketolase
MVNEELCAELQTKALSIRKEIVKMIYNAASGHPGGALSLADILTSDVG